MPQETRELALDLFQAWQGYLQETSARNTRGRASLRNGQYPAASAVKEIQRSSFQRLLDWNGPGLS